MKNDLNEHIDIKESSRLLLSHASDIKNQHGISTSKLRLIYIVAFNAICTHVGTWDLVQEFLAFKIWPLVAEWEMSKMFEKDASDLEPGLIRLRI